MSSATGYGTPDAVSFHTVQPIFIKTSAWWQNTNTLRTTPSYAATAQTDQPHRAILGPWAYLYRHGTTLQACRRRYVSVFCDHQLFDRSDLAKRQGAAAGGLEPEGLNRSRRLCGAYHRPRCRAFAGWYIPNRRTTPGDGVYQNEGLILSPSLCTGFKYKEGWAAPRLNKLGTGPGASKTTWADKDIAAAVKLYSQRREGSIQFRRFLQQVKASFIIGIPDRQATST